MHFQAKHAPAKAGVRTGSRHENAIRKRESIFFDQPVSNGSENALGNKKGGRSRPDPSPVKQASAVQLLRDLALETEGGRRQFGLARLEQEGIKTAAMLHGAQAVG